MAPTRRTTRSQTNKSPLASLQTPPRRKRGSRKAAPKRSQQEEAPAEPAESETPAPVAVTAASGPHPVPFVGTDAATQTSPLAEQSPVDSAGAAAPTEEQQRPSPSETWFSRALRMSAARPFGSRRLLAQGRRNGEELLPLTLEEVNLVRQHRASRAAASPPSASAGSESPKRRRGSEDPSEAEGTDTDGRPTRRTRRRLNGPEASGSVPSVLFPATQEREQEESSPSPSSSPFRPSSPSPAPQALVPSVTPAPSGIRRLWSRSGLMSSSPSSSSAVTVVPRNRRKRHNLLPGTRSKRFIEGGERLKALIPSSDSDTGSSDMELETTTAEQADSRSPGMSVESDSTQANQWSLGNWTNSLSRIFRFSASEEGQQPPPTTPSSSSTGPLGAKTSPDVSSRRHISATQSVPPPRRTQRIPFQPPSTALRNRDFNAGSQKPRRKPLIGSRRHRELREKRTQRILKERAEAEANAIKAQEQEDLQRKIQEAEKGTKTGQKRKLTETQLAALGDRDPDTFNWAGCFCVPESSTDSDTDEDSPRSQSSSASRNSRSVFGAQPPTKRVKFGDVDFREHPDELVQYEDDPTEPPRYLGAVNAPSRAITGGDPTSTSDPSSDVASRIGQEQTDSQTTPSQENAPPAKKTKKIIRKRTYHAPPGASFGLVYDLGIDSDSDEEIEVTDSEDESNQVTQAPEEPRQNIFVEAERRSGSSSALKSALFKPPQKEKEASAPKTQKVSFEKTSQKSQSKPDARSKHPASPRPSSSHAEPSPASKPSSSSPSSTEKAKKGISEGGAAPTTESDTALSRARLQAEKYKPKTPSGLRATSRLSSSTVQSDVPELTPSPPSSSSPPPPIEFEELQEPLSRDGFTLDDELFGDEDMDSDVQSLIQQIPETELGQEPDLPLGEIDLMAYGVEPVVWDLALQSNGAYWQGRDDQKQDNFSEDFARWRNEQEMKDLEV